MLVGKGKTVLFIRPATWDREGLVSKKTALKIPLNYFFFKSAFAILFYFFKFLLKFLKGEQFEGRDQSLLSSAVYRLSSDCW